MAKIDNEIISGGRRHNGGRGHNNNRQPGLTGIDFWEGPFSGNPQINAAEQILAMPGVEDMAGVLSRANFKNERQRIAAVRWAYKNRLFNDDGHQQMLRDYVAAGIGIKALGKVLQIQAQTDLALPGVMREVLEMKQPKHREDVVRGSDFREEKTEVQKLP